MKFLLASILIIATALNPLAWSKHAYALGPSDEGQVAFDFALEVPGGGALDRYHNPFQLTDHISNSLYALRNVAVEDLLNTRKALKFLLGGTERARKIKKDTRLSFGVPDPVLTLYVSGKLGWTNDEFTLEEYNPRNASHLPETAVSNAFRSEVDQAVQWLDSNEPKYDENLRDRLAAGLLYVASLLSRYDQHLKFYQEDFWQGEVWKDFYYGHVVPLLATDIDSPFVLQQTIESEKRAWLKEHKMDEAIAVLAGHREYLLDRYHILAIPVEGKPLYAHLYEALRKDSGFPDAKMKQSPVEPRLPSGTDPIPLPDGFDKKFDAALESLAKDSTERGGKVMKSLLAGIHPKVDLALLESLKANTNRLVALTSEIHFKRTEASALLDIALYPEVWEGAKSKYGYLDGVIAFDQAKKKLEDFFKKREKNRKVRRYVGYGLGIGLGVVAIVASAGTAGTFLGIGARAYLVGSGLVTAAQATTDYVDSKKTAEIERNLFFGTARVGSHAAMKQAILIAAQDYRAMIASFLMLGVDLGAVGAIAKTRSLVMSGGRAFVQLSKTELKLLQTQVTKIATRAEALAPLGRAMLSTARHILGMTRATQVLRPLGEAAEIVAMQMKMTKAAVIEKLQKNAYIGRIVQDYGDIVQMEPKFMRMMLREQAVSFTIGMTSEVMARGSKFKDELGYVAFDILTGAGMTASMVFIVGRNAMRAEKLGLNGIRRPKTVFDKGFTMKDRGKQFADSFKSNFLVGVTWNAGGQVIMEAFQDNDESLGDRAGDVLKMGAFGGVFMGISSNLRYQFMGHVSNLIGKSSINKTGGAIAITGLSAANQLFGGWHWVKLAKHWGIQGDDGKVVPMNESTPENQLANGNLVINETESALLKLEGDDDAVGYIYDFLREGDDAGPAPILY